MFTAEVIAHLHGVEEQKMIRQLSGEFEMPDLRQAQTLLDETGEIISAADQ